jgi:hypothetical protein
LSSKTGLWGRKLWQETQFEKLHPKEATDIALVAEIRLGQKRRLGRLSFESQSRTTTEIGISDPRLMPEAGACLCISALYH